MLEPLVDAPDPLALSLTRAGLADARKGIRVITDAPPPVRTAGLTPRPAVPRVKPAPPPAIAPPSLEVLIQPPTRAMRAMRAVREAVVAPAIDEDWREALHPPSERSNNEVVDASFGQLDPDDALDPVQERTMATDPQQPRRWTVPEDVPQAILIIPIVLGITIISTVVGAVILF